MSSNPNCWSCFDTQHVCENHPTRPWDDGRGTFVWGKIGYFTCNCGGAGMPCPKCAKGNRVPQDGTHPITEAFEPHGA